MRCLLVVLLIETTLAAGCGESGSTRARGHGGAAAPRHRVTFVGDHPVQDLHSRAGSTMQEVHQAHLVTAGSNAHLPGNGRASSQASNGTPDAVRGFAGCGHGLLAAGD